jgi:hypothetical protein
MIVADYKLTKNLFLCQQNKNNTIHSVLILSDKKRIRHSIQKDLQCDSYFKHVVRNGSQTSEYK